MDLFRLTSKTFIVHRSVYEIRLLDLVGTTGERADVHPAGGVQCTAARLHLTDTPHAATRYGSSDGPALEKVK